MIAGDLIIDAFMPSMDAGMLPKPYALCPIYLVDSSSSMACNSFSRSSIVSSVTEYLGELSLGFVGRPVILVIWMNFKQFVQKWPVFSSEDIGVEQVYIYPLS